VILDEVKRIRHNPVELRALTANKDRLMTEAVRRRQGAFFTPSDWVDEAHRMLEAELGANWKEEYVVYDCSCGSANLTRDYSFKELYLSTLEEVDIGIIKEAGYNPGATVFQFDFLNDSLDSLPEGLLNSLKEGKRFCFLNNPPYMAAGDTSNKEGDAHRNTGECKTQAWHDMKKDEIGGASKNLYAQFLFRINTLIEKHNLKDVVLATFSKATFLCNSQFKGFREKIITNYGYKNGMLFQASHFSDVSTAWGILFSIFKKGEEKRPYTVNLKDYDEETGKIVTTGTKELYNLDGVGNAGEWFRATTKGKKMVDVPQFSSALELKPNDYNSLTEDSIGSCYLHSNSCQYNQTNAAIFSSCCNCAGSSPVTPANFDRAVALFAARKLIEPNWVNDKDEYMVPNEQHLSYQQFVNDSIVYSLFHSASNQSSLRNITYKEKQWNILNHFFWMSMDTIRELAITHNNTAVYNDVIAHPKNRYVYDKLQTITLSTDAQELIALASQLVIDSFPMRQIVNELEPKFHLNTWDAGWYQIRNGILKEQFPDRYKEFCVKYKGLGNRLRPLVYDLGFLLPGPFCGKPRHRKRPLLGPERA